MGTGDHWLDDLLERAGQPIPCEICGIPTPAANLTETSVPARIVFGDIIVYQVVWVCPACPSTLRECARDRRLYRRRPL